MSGRKYVLAKYLLMFFAASFIGWLYEITCIYVLFKTYMDRGVLHLPCCPIYGFGILILYFVFGKIKNPFAIFIGSTVITTAVEYATYMIVLNRFHVTLWTYEGWYLNYKGRISAVSSCIFGLMAVLFLKLAVPLLDRVFASKAGKYVSYGVFILYLFCIFWEMRFIG